MEEKIKNRLKNKTFEELAEELKSKDSMELLSWDDMFELIWKEAQKEAYCKISARVLEEQLKLMDEEGSEK